MNQSYPFSLIEKRAQDFWSKHKSFVTDVTDNSKPKFYCLAMFPYTSGSLHMGHVRIYVISDMLNRFKKMQGYNVLHPMGWDSFGLPAENASRLHHVSARAWTYRNRETMKNQLIDLGIGYDWNKEILTCEPEYYKHQQWFFIQLYKKGLAYRKNGFLYWDPVDQTVLANEQVVDGRGWRSNALVEIIEKEQWYISVQEYIEELYEELENNEHWPQELITMQRNWIGKSEGHIVSYALTDKIDNIDVIEVFTTKLETIMSIACIMISPQHKISMLLAESNSVIKDFIKRNTFVTEKAHTDGIEGLQTMLKVIHPITQAILPVWIVSFVKYDYATGAVGCSPAHDKRDNEFASQYGIDFFPVIKEEILINSGPLNGMTIEEARMKIMTSYTTSITPKTYFRLKDWCISRQRYWGCPIPAVHCPTCGIIMDERLPVLMPLKDDLAPENYNLPCPKCHGAARREMDTFDTFVESSWYYTRYICPNAEQMVSQDVNKWLPVDYYIGGIEHATLHFLYVRLFHKMMRDMFSFSCNEPFKHVLTQGMILNQGVKMSKSKGNSIIPRDVTDQYGVDSMRMFIIMAAPPKKSFDWDEGGLIGVSRFLNKLYQFSTTINYHDLDLSTNKTSTNMISIVREMNLCIEYMETEKFNNVATSCMKILINLQQQQNAHDIYEGFKILLLLLHPIAPHITHELWINLGYGTDILYAPYPVKRAVSSDVETLVIQINGKKIAVLHTQDDLSQPTILHFLLTHNNLKKRLENLKIKKVIYVKNKVANIVV